MNGSPPRAHPELTGKVTPLKDTLLSKGLREETESTTAVTSNDDDYGKNNSTGYHHRDPEDTTNRTKSDKNNTDKYREEPTNLNTDKPLSPIEKVNEV